MGVVHMLVVALLGITYGWQSDGSGGVEYIVQVSPTELREIDRLGEITSSIDPAVAGHVSRIKIRVGTGTLPRETPVHLSARSSRSDQAGRATEMDRVAVPIPEMGDPNLAAPIRTLDTDGTLIAAGSRHAQATMMKPDPDNAGPGFQFPATLGNTANSAAAGMRSDLDQAGRSIIGQGQNMLQGLQNTASNTLRNSAVGTNGMVRVPAPGTRQPDPARQPSIPQFTNGRPATTLAGGPTTESTNSRDQSWSDFARPRVGGPTTDTIGADRSRLNNPQFKDPRVADSRDPFGPSAASSSVGSSNRTSNGTFGQAPGGMTFPSRNTTTDPRMTVDRSSQPNASVNGFTRDQIISQQQQMELDRQNRTIRSNEFAGGTAFPNTTREQLPRNNVGSQNRETRDIRFGSDAVAGTLPSTDSGQGPDRRLTNAELDAGAWSIDRYGRLLDRTGRLITPLTQNDAQRDLGTNLDDRYGNRQPRATLEQPLIRTNPNLVRDVRSNDQIAVRDTRERAYQQPDIRPSVDANLFTQNQMDPSRTGPPANIRTAQVRDPNALSNRDASLAGTAGTNPIAKTARNHIAAQPLFNGLLLMSFVANIYLMFWLKNLRLRFRDLVAAKRLTGTSNQPS